MNLSAPQPSSKNKNHLLGAVTTVQATEYYPEQHFTQISALGSKWAFPSDHLPVAATIEGLKVCSFNVLNSEWIYYFNKDHQGLAESQIITDHVPVSEGSEWTRREERILELVLELSTKVDFLAIQECSFNLLLELRRRIPEGYKIISGQYNLGKDPIPKNQIIAIYNSNELAFDAENSRTGEAVYSVTVTNTVMDLRFNAASGKSFQIFHSHVPGSPLNPYLANFRDYVQSNIEPNCICIILGDLNFNEETVRQVFQGQNFPDFTRVSVGNTHIGSAQGKPVVKDLDHILVIDPSAEASVIEPIKLSQVVDEHYKLINPN